MNEESQVDFTEDNGLPCIEIDNKFANATIYLHGAHVASFAPKGEEDLLWMSEFSYFEDNKPIRGGIPICWPWFGAHPSDNDKPSHGFARLARWDVFELESLPDGRTKIVLELNSNEETLAMWNYNFNLQCVIIIGSTLEVELTTTNCDTKAFEITSALHSYFDVENVADIAISGLENVDYVDSLDDDKIKNETSEIKFDKEIDRVYLNIKDRTLISSPKRKIAISKEGSSTTVVWNPWIDKAQRMPDFGDDEYKTMVCVETTNALDDKVRIEPLKSHSLKAIISLIEL